MVFEKKVVLTQAIDNHQGEESDIVIVSLTRSNWNRDIGFMAASQRLNTLLSPARDILIMVGNANTSQATSDESAGNHSSTS